MADEEIEPAVAVVVEPERARREARVGDAGALRHVFEAAAAAVPEKMIAAERRDVDVDVAVVVEVRRGHAEAVHLDREPGGSRDVGEGAVVIVAIERRIRFSALVASPVHRVDEENVLPAVVVDVEEGAAGPQRFGQVFLAERAAVVPKMETRGGGDVGEMDGRTPVRRRTCARHDRERAEESRRERGESPTDWGLHRTGDGSPVYFCTGSRPLPCSWICCRSLLSSG